MEAKEQNNVINLVDHLNTNEAIETFTPSEFSYFKIQNDKITKRRVYSFLVDFSVIMLINTAVHVAYSVFVKNFMFALNAKQQSFLIGSNTAVQLSIFMLIYTTYFFYSMFVLNGQTIGKMTFKLKTVKDGFIFDEDVISYTPSASEAWRRTFGYIACYASFGTFFLFSFMSEDNRGVPDYFSQTRTVSNEWFEAMLSYKRSNKEEVKIDIIALDQAA